MNLCTKKEDVSATMPGCCCGRRSRVESATQDFLLLHHPTAQTPPFLWGKLCSGHKIRPPHPPFPSASSRATISPGRAPPPPPPNITTTPPRFFYEMTGTAAGTPPPFAPRYTTRCIFPHRASGCLRAARGRKRPPVPTQWAGPRGLLLHGQDVLIDGFK